jgi:prolyl 4-hydroxylase
MFLATPEEGGETVFPDAEVQSPPDPSFSPCARKGLVNKPYKGDMLM